MRQGQAGAAVSAGLGYSRLLEHLEGAYEPETPDQIAEALDVSTSRVRILLQRAVTEGRAMCVGRADGGCAPERGQQPTLWVAS